MTDSHSQPTPEPVRQHAPTPWRVNTYSRDIYADNVLNGPMRIADIRGWGYLTGKGHGGLSDNDAMAVQAANAALIVEAVNSHASLTARVEELENWNRLRAEDIINLGQQVGRLEAALEQSVKLQSHYAELLNMHDGGKRITFAGAQEWIDRLAALPQSSTPARTEQERGE